MRFRLFDIPVTVDPFFLIGLVLVWSWAGGDRRGMFAAIFVGVLTVVHELGHAMTARRFGASTAITLNLLVGWASYSAPRPLSRRQRNLISLAGPLSQIVASLPVLYLSYVMLHDHPTELWFDVWVGMVWAGIVIGLLNLLPLWPLDGGHVVDTFLGGTMGERRGRRVMLIATLVAVGLIFVIGMAAQNPEPPYSDIERMVVEAKEAPLAVLDPNASFVSAVWEQVRHFPGNVLDFPFLLLIFCGMNSYLALRRLPRHDRVATWMDVQLAPKQANAASATRSEVPAAARDAERIGWMDGAVPPFPSGWGPSPWLVAHHRMQRGDATGAKATLMTVTQAGRPRWTLPEPADQPDLAALTEMLPDPLPAPGDPERSLLLQRVLTAHGSAAQIANYGVALYSATSDPEALYLTAAGLGRTGHGDEAMAWLRRAVQDRPDHQRLATDRGLWPLHTRPDFQQLLAEARARGG